MMASPVIDELEVTKKLIAWGERAAKQGLDLSVDLQPSIDKPQQMQRLVHYVRSGCPPLTGIVYDAKTVCGILGFPNNCTEEAPKATDGEVVVWYGGWTLGELVATGKVCNYLSKEWEGWKAPAGYYHTRIPVPESDRMTHDEQVAYLGRSYPALKELHTPVGVTALLVHFGITGEDLLNESFCRCAEVLPNGFYVDLYVLEGCVDVSRDCGNSREDAVFLGAARKS